jgi:hypothetical protein
MLIIITSILFTFYFITMARIPVRIGINFRPFNCHMCLAVWVAAALYFLPGYVTEIGGIVFAAGCLAPLFSQGMNYLQDKLAR